MAKSLKEVIREEYGKCAVDPIYFMRKYCKIQHPIKGKIPFDLYSFQEDVLSDFKDNRFNVVLKSRQLGISTLVAGFSLWKMIFNNDFNVLVIATKQEVAKNLVLKVRVMNEFLPSWLKVTEQEDNKLSLRFTNGSQIKAISSKPDAGRSEALSLLVFDEAAFIDYIEEIWTSAQSTLSTGGSCIALSTPNGVGNWFHQVWVGAENKTNLFNPIKLHWTVHPDRDQSWREEQEIQLGKKGAAQECDCDFISTGDTVIDSEILVKYLDRVEEPIERKGFDGNFWIWKRADYTKSYLLCADVARGDGADYSAFHIIELENCEQVAEYKGKLDPKEFGNFLVNAATEYNDALLVIDNANIGWATIQQVLDREYRNLFYSNDDIKYVDIDTQWTNKWYRKEKNMTPGFGISSKTRPLIVSKIDNYMKENSVVLKSKRLMDEFFVFIWGPASRAEAMRGYNDDLIFALGIGLWIRDTALRLRQEGIDLTRTSLGAITQTSYEMFYSSTDFRENPYKMKVNGQAEDEDLTWLIDRSSIRR